MGQRLLPLQIYSDGTSDLKSVSRQLLEAFLPCCPGHMLNGDLEPCTCVEAALERGQLDYLPLQMSKD